MKKFKDFISEEVIPTAHVEDGSIDLEKPAVRGQINATLAAVTAQPAVTPYVVLHRIMKALAHFSIILPKKTFMEGDKGIEVYELNQFGDKFGMTDQGEFVHHVPAKYYLFMQYGVTQPLGVTYAVPNVGGMYKVTAKVVDKEALDGMLTAAEVVMKEDCYDKATRSQRYAKGEDIKTVDDQGTESAKKAVAASRLEEKAPPGAKFERMVKHIKKSYAGGGLTDAEKAKAYGRAWAEYKKQMDEEKGDRLVPQTMNNPTGRDKTGASERDRGISIVPQGDSSSQATLPSSGKYTNRVDPEGRKNEYAPGGALYEKRHETPAEKTEKHEMAKIAKHAIAKGADIKKLPPGKKKLGEEQVDEAGGFSYGVKKPRKGSLKADISKQRKEYEAKRPVIEPKDQMVGTAKITKKQSIDEVSKEKLDRYREKAFDVSKRAMYSGDKETERKRDKGREIAFDKLTGRAKVHAKEESLEEMNRERGSLLGGYISRTNPDYKTPKEVEKRKEGRALALKKMWGDKKFGLDEPKVKAVHRGKLDELYGKGDIEAIASAHHKKAMAKRDDVPDTENPHIAAHARAGILKSMRDSSNRGAYKGMAKVARAEQKKREKIDEVSKEMLHRYVKRAGGTSLDSVGARMLDAKGNWGSKSFTKGINRAKGIERAVDKLSGSAKVHAKEESLDEVSKETLASYIPKAAHSMALMTAKRIHKGVDHPEYEKSLKKQTMRHRGITTAAEKLAMKEDAGNVEENRYAVNPRNTSGSMGLSQLGKTMASANWRRRAKQHRESDATSTASKNNRKEETKKD